MMNVKPLVLALTLLASGAVGASVKETETFSYTLADGGSFSVSNVNGSITISGGSGETVEITVTKKADKQEYLDGIEINISHSANSIEIETELPDSQSWFSRASDNGQVTYVIKVPVGTNLDSVETVNGEIKISAVAGKVLAESVNGDLDLDGLSADADLSTVNGNISAAFVECKGRQKISAETVNGRVTLSLPKNTDANVSVDTLSGSINASDFELKADKGFIGSNLNGNIGDGSARLNIDTVNGSVKIKRH